MNKNLRTAKTQRKLERYYAECPDVCFICERKPLKRFKYWKIIANLFPYDRIASRHEMLVPLRHVPLEGGLNAAEKKELLHIKEEYLPRRDYDWIIENLPRQKSAPEHFHLHLVKHR